MTIGKAIKELRKERGMSQGVLANASNITQTALSQIENGRRPSAETLKNICAALQVPEAIIHIMTLDKSDVPRSKQDLYDQLFPVIKSLIRQMVS